MKRLGTPVIYHGISIYIEYPYVVVDGDGLIVNYERKPIYFESLEEWGYRQSPNNYSIQELGYVDLEGMKPEDTLAYYPQLNRERNQ